VARRQRPGQQIPFARKRRRDSKSGSIFSARQLYGGAMMVRTHTLRGVAAALVLAALAEPARAADAAVGQPAPDFRLTTGK
jgi:hypothetical protein